MRYSHRHINQAGIYLTKHFEGFVPVIYFCPAKVETIGYGETDKVIIEQYRGKKISEPEAEKLLIKSLKKYSFAVYNLINSRVPLSDNEFSALVSFSYNLGIRSLRDSTLRKVILREEYEEAPNQFKRWVYAGGRKLNGLVKRRRAEIDLWNK